MAVKMKSVCTNGMVRLPAQRDEALAEPLAEDAAAAQGVERANRLESGPERIRERVQPDVDARLDVPEQAVGDE